MSSLNTSSSHLIWHDMIVATDNAAARHEDALQVAMTGEGDAAAKALVAKQSEWRDAVRASATARVRVTRVRKGATVVKHTADYIMEKELAG